MAADKKTHSEPRVRRSSDRSDDDEIRQRVVEESERRRAFEEFLRQRRPRSSESHLERALNDPDLPEDTRSGLQALLEDRRASKEEAAGVREALAATRHTLRNTKTTEEAIAPPPNKVPKTHRFDEAIYAETRDIVEAVGIRITDYINAALAEKNAATLSDPEIRAEVDAMRRLRAAREASTSAGNKDRLARRILKHEPR